MAARTALPTDAQKECAAMLEAAGMLSFTAHRIAGFKRDTDGSHEADSGYV
jgi:hypothetical protein